MRRTTRSICSCVRQEKDLNEVLDFQENPARLLCKGYKGRTYALYQYPIYSKEELMRKAGEFADRSPADGHDISG